MDDDLRRLERLAARGDGASRVRWSRALLRAGEGASALAALLAARDDPAVRAELLTWPAWTSEDGDAGRTRAVAGAAVATPRVLYRTRTARGARWLLASPLALVAGARDRTLVLDPETGEVRHDLPPAGAGHLAGDVLLLERHEPVAFDLVTGTRLPGLLERAPRDKLALALGPAGHGAARAQHEEGASGGAGLLLAADGPSVRLYRAPDLRAPPALVRERTLEGDEATRVALAGPDTALLTVRTRTERGLTFGVLALGLPDLEPRWRAGPCTGVGVAADAEGALLGLGDAVSCRDAAGREVWCVRGTPRALARDVAVVGRWGEPRPSLALVERATGREVHTIALSRRRANGLVALATGLAYVWTGPDLWDWSLSDEPELEFAGFEGQAELLAVALDGAQRWRVPTADLVASPLAALVAVPHRLYLFALDGTLVAIGEP